MTTQSHSGSSQNSISINPEQRPHVHKAIRKLPTKDLSRQDWLEARKAGIGASEAAAAVGLSPWQSQLELWMLKTGRMADQPEDNDQARAPMYWGNVLEPVVAKHYQQLTGRKVRRVNAILQHPEEPWMLANLDYRVVGSDEVQILECKTVGQYGVKQWQNGVPEYIQCQVQHQLAVTGQQAADVAALICGQEFRVYRIERDDALIEQLMELERQFWTQVQLDSPPSADASESARNALALLYPNDTGECLDWSGKPAHNHTFQQLLDVREQMEQLKARESGLKNQLQEALGDASEAVLASGRISFKRTKDQTVLNSKALLKDMPELLERYPTIRKGSRRFLVKA